MARAISLHRVGIYVIFLIYIESRYINTNLDIYRNPYSSCGMKSQSHRGITLRITTVERLCKAKRIDTESFDSLINFLLDQMELGKSGRERG